MPKYVALKARGQAYIAELENNLTPHIKRPKFVLQIISIR